MFHIKITKRISISPIGMSASQMSALGDATVTAMKARWVKGLDVKDQPAAPLSRGYAARKRRLGAKAQPDLRLTGQLQAALGVRLAEAGRCRIGFADSQSTIKAYVNHQLRNQIGISDGDAAQVRPLAVSFLIENVRASIQSVAA